MRFLRFFFIPLAAAIAAAVPLGGAYAMSQEGCGAGKCTDCHDLTIQEARELLKGVADDVKNIRLSDVGGLWEVDALAQGQTFPLYIDFSKQFLLSGQVVRIATKENITQKRFMEMNPVDVSRIPLDDALVIGNPKAKRRIIVFDDPECPYCIKLHEEIKAAVKKDPSVVFFIKMFPLPSHPNAYEKAKAIVCAKSVSLLEDSFAGKPVPPAPAVCKSSAVDDNIALGKKIGVRSTPSLILPNGYIVPGFKKADDILALLNGKK